MKTHCLILFLAMFIWGCDRNSSTKEEPLTVIPLNGDYRELIDGAGRKFVLVPRGQKTPSGYPADRVIETPVRRLASTSRVDVGLLSELGVLDNTLVGITGTLDSWARPDIRQGMKTGKIVSLGTMPIDYERLKIISPEVLLVSNLEYEAMVREMGISSVVTYYPMNIGLESQITKIAFLAPLFNKEDQARLFIRRMRTSIDYIYKNTREVEHRPAVLWGDIYRQNPVVEPPDCWMAEFIELAGGNYLLGQNFHGFHQMMSLETFYDLGRHCDILFSFRLPEEGMISKAAMKKIQPLLADIRPLNEGRVVLNRKILHESLEQLDEILLEMARILHPEIFGQPEYKFFFELQ